MACGVEVGWKTPPCSASGQPLVAGVDKEWLIMPVRVKKVDGYRVTHGGMVIECQEKVAKKH